MKLEEALKATTLDKAIEILKKRLEVLKNGGSVK